MKYCSACKSEKDDALFSKNTRRCKPCDALARKKYVENNKEKELARKKKWRDENKDLRKSYQKQYQKDNMFRWNDDVARRKSLRLKNGTFEITDKDMRGLYSSACTYCGSAEKISIDHVIPLSRGGAHGIGNLVPACLKCNLSKNAKTIMEWRLYTYGLPSVSK